MSETPTPQLRIVPPANSAGPKRRGRQPGSTKPEGSGRQPGTPNAVSAATKATVKAALDKRGPALVQRAVNIALGLKMRVGPAAGPNPTYAYPSEVAQMKALELCFRKLLPDLRADEITGRDGEALLPAAPADARETAKSVLALLTAGVAGAVTIEEPGVHVARFHDPDLARRLDIGGEAVADPTSSPEPATPASESPSPSTGIWREGQAIVAPATATHWGIYRAAPRDKRDLMELRDSRDEAIGRARALIEAGKL